MFLGVNHGFAGSHRECQMLRSVAFGVELREGAFKQCYPRFECLRGGFGNAAVIGIAKRGNRRQIGDRKVEIGIHLIYNRFTRAGWLAQFRAIFVECFQDQRNASIFLHKPKIAPCTKETCFGQITI
ncbi:hypothetical protein D3C87_1703180 [compost metagenome]